MTAVYAVHAVRADEICATEVIFDKPDKAEFYAQALSTDPGGLAGAVTEFVLNTPGERHPVSLYVGGVRQEVPHLSDDRQVAANGHVQHRSLRWNGRS
ncbi:MAG: hypothetical protein JO100_13820 [Pseudonocardia sp.]|nr:hypothetical protein [Pseudonocardia sp.]